MGFLAAIFFVGSNLVGFGFGIFVWCSMVGLVDWFGVSMVFHR